MNTHANTREYKWKSVKICENKLFLREKCSFLELFANFEENCDEKNMNTCKKKNCRKIREYK
jgi:hypothetical protein